MDRPTAAAPIPANGADPAALPATESPVLVDRTRLTQALATLTADTDDADVQRVLPLVQGLGDSPEDLALLEQWATHHPVDAVREAAIQAVPSRQGRDLLLQARLDPAPPVRVAALARMGALESAAGDANSPEGGDEGPLFRSAVLEQLLLDSDGDVLNGGLDYLENHAPQELSQAVTGLLQRSDVPTETLLHAVEVMSDNSAMDLPTFAVHLAASPALAALDPTLQREVMERLQHLSR